MRDKRSATAATQGRAYYASEETFTEERLPEEYSGWARRPDGRVPAEEGIPGETASRRAGSYPSVEALEAELMRAMREEASRRSGGRQKQTEVSDESPGESAKGVPRRAGARRRRAQDEAEAAGGASVPRKAAGPEEQTEVSGQREERHYPSVESLEAELRRSRYKRRFWRILLGTIEKLIVVAAIAVLVATIWLPVLRIYGSSMTPTLNEGDIVVTFKGSSFTTGDVVGLYVGNRLLVKRVIAGPGQWVDIKEDGTVYVDNKALEEPYLTEKAFGDCNIELPYQVPEARYFVMGDHRSTSVDSRHSTVGCIADEEIVGRIMFRVWPVSDIGKVDRK